MASHVSQCMAKACMCDTWHAMCQHAWYTLKAINMGIKFNSRAIQFVGATRRRRRKGGEEKRKGGKERRKGGKEKKMKEEKRRRKGRKRGKRKRKRKECCAVSRSGRQRIRNCATRGRFPPTLVILRLGVV